MKNLFKSMFIVLCGMMVATTFVACGSDDDEGNGNGNNNNGGSTSTSIIGTWTTTASETHEGHTYTWQEYITFNSDNTGKTWVVEDGGEVGEAGFTFTWTLSGKTFKITPISGEWDDDIITSMTLVSVSSTTLVINNGESNYTYTRVK